MTTSFNATKDKIGYYVETARDTAAEIEVLLLLTAGLQTDAVLADHANISALLAASNDEATFTNYTRKTLASPTRTVDNSLERVLLGGAAAGNALAITWASAGGAVNNALSKVVFYFNPAAGSAETAKLPLMATDITATTDGNDLVVTLHADGFARVKN